MEKSEVKKSDNSYVADKKSPLQKVGDFLKEARQGRNLSIEDLSSSLRIGKEQLIALEEGDETSLPEKVFIRAMVRRIAEKLNLDTSFIFEQLREKAKNEPKVAPKIKEELPRINKKINPIIMVILSGALGLIASYILLNLIKNNGENSINRIKNEMLVLEKIYYFR